MVSNKQRRGRDDPEKREKGIAEHEREHYIPLRGDDKDRRDEPHKRDMRETDDPAEVDREGGDIAGTASGNLDEDEARKK